VVSKQRVMAAQEFEILVPGRRVTRSLLQNGLLESLPSKPAKSPNASRRSKSKKKVKFVEPPSDDKVKNTSLVSDEGIDMAFTPLLSLPSTISRPVHELKQHWSLWYSSKNKKSSWNENQHIVCTMATIEDFWHCHNQVKLASKLPAGQTYAVFRKGVIPDWEDAANKDGGRWLLHYEKRERAIRLDERWMEVLVLALGNHLNSAVTGVQVCVRGKEDRIEVWLVHTTDMREVVAVGRKLKMQLGQGLTKMEFSLHNEEKEGFKGPCLMI